MVCMVRCEVERDGYHMKAAGESGTCDLYNSGEPEAKWLLLALTELLLWFYSCLCSCLSHVVSVMQHVP